MAGASLYAADAARPGMIFGRVLRATASPEVASRPSRDPAARAHRAMAGARRGPNALAIECAIDEAALATGADPLAFRLAHVEDPRLAAVLTRVGEIAFWGAPAVSDEGQGRTGLGIACGIYKGASYAAAIAEVAMDRSGRAQVTRLWCVRDCGLVINPDQVRARCEGNLVWSIGMVLSDELSVEGGRVIAETFGDAPIPRMTEVPPITVELIQRNHSPTGAGETAIVVGPGAIANAIRAATGRRPTRFPHQPEEVAI